MIRAASLLFLCLVSLASAAPKETGALFAAQSFYDGYMKLLTSNGDTQAYVQNSENTTDAFKIAYKAFMNEPGSDPIICGQDYPDAGFSATKPVVEGDKATVTMKSKDSSFDHSFKVFLQRTDKGWRINATQDLAGKP